MSNPDSDYWSESDYPDIIGPVTQHRLTEGQPPKTYAPLSPEEVQRRRLLRKLKARVVGLAKSTSTLRGNWEYERQPCHKMAKRWIDSGYQRERAKLRLNARATYVAYGFLRGRALWMIENKPKTPPHWGRVQAIILAHSHEDSRVVLQRLAEWREGK